MSYVEQNLMPGEEVIYRATLHWIIYAGSVLPGLLGLIFLVLSVANHNSRGFAIVGLLLLIITGFLFLSRWIMAKTSEFAITNKRVIIKIGLIQRHTLELLLAKVESIGVDQNIMGRILDYGNIIVIGTGGTRETFKNIAQPLEFRKQVQARVIV